ncbi:MAG: hypothetical protein WCJ64_27140 [Rhodospirillaceae bacterium]
MAQLSPQPVTVMSRAARAGTAIFPMSPAKLSVARAGRWPAPSKARAVRLEPSGCWVAAPSPATSCSSENAVILLDAVYEPALVALERAGGWRAGVPPFRREAVAGAGYSGLSGARPFLRHPHRRPCTCAYACRTYGGGAGAGQSGPKLRQRPRLHPLHGLWHLLRDPDIIYGVAPQNITKYTDFMAKVGAISKAPASWQDMFFPEIHHLPGS